MLAELFGREGADAFDFREEVALGRLADFPLRVGRRAMLVVVAIAVEVVHQFVHPAVGIGEDGDPARAGLVLFRKLFAAIGAGVDLTQILVELRQHFRVAAIVIVTFPAAQVAEIDGVPFFPETEDFGTFFVMQFVTECDEGCLFVRFVLEPGGEESFDLLESLPAVGGQGLVAAAADALSVGILQREVPGVAVFDVEHRLVAFFVAVHLILLDERLQGIHHGSFGEEYAVAVIAQFHGYTRLAICEAFGAVAPVGEPPETVRGGIIKRIECRRIGPAPEQGKQGHQDKEFFHGRRWMVSLKTRCTELRKPLSEIDGTPCRQVSSISRSR